MNLSEETIRVLREFSTINQSIIIYTGDVIRTIHEDRSIICEYRPGVEFNEKICIYDLPRFLNAMKIIGPEINLRVEDNMIYLSGDSNNTIRYSMAPEETIISMNHEVDSFDAILSFDLSHEQLKVIRQTMGALNVKHVSFSRNDDNSILVKVYQLESDRSNPTDDYYTFTIESSQSNATGDPGSYEFIFDIMSLPSYDGNYRVNLSEDNIAMFEHKNLNLKYWLSLREESGAA